MSFYTLNPQTIKREKHPETCVSVGTQHVVSLSTQCTLPFPNRMGVGGRFMKRPSLSIIDLTNTEFETI